MFKLSAILILFFGSQAYGSVRLFKSPIVCNYQNPGPQFISKYPEAFDPIKPSIIAYEESDGSMALDFYKGETTVKMTWVLMTISVTQKNQFSPNVPFKRRLEIDLIPFETGLFPGRFYSSDDPNMPPSTGMQCKFYSGKNLLIVSVPEAFAEAAALEEAKVACGGAAKPAGVALQLYTPNFSNMPFYHTTQAFECL